MDGETDMSMHDTCINTIDFTNQFKKSINESERMDEWISASADRWMNI